MEVVLLQRVENLGQMGQVVTVKPGYARNFLIPRKKALRATKENLAFFEAQRKVLEATNLQNKKEAEAVAKKMDKLSIVVIRQAADSGKLYGSVSPRDIVEAVNAKGFKISRDQVVLNESVKALGLFTAKVTLHPEITLDITVNVARSEDEAKLQAERGAAVVKNAAAAAAAAEEKASDQPTVDATAFLDTKAVDAA